MVGVPVMGNALGSAIDNAGPVPGQSMPNMGKPPFAQPGPSVPVQRPPAQVDPGSERGYNPKPTKGPLQTRDPSPTGQPGKSGMENTMDALADRLYPPKMKSRR